MKLFLVGLLLTSCVFAVDSDWSRDRKKAPSANEKNTGGADRLGKPLDEMWRIVFRNSKGQDVVLDCEVARSDKDKERGLMFRKSLPKNRGMIFVYKKPEEMNFWMQNTIIPLSIAYIHERLFVSSLHDMKPFSLDIVGSETAVLYAIEANQGWFKSNAILSGNRLTIYTNPGDYKIERKNKYRKVIP
ncbi:MAG: DUF192 domain-containing protein [Spirochaetes bacterium]|nr:DUF192 domain-containing protein [Spirochaetota bacterium]